MRNIAIKSIVIGAVLAVGIAAGAAAEAVANLLANPGFETPQVDAANASPKPDGWSIFSREPDPAKIALSTAAVKTGKQSMKFTCNGVADSYQGIAQAVPVSDGKKYELIVFVGNDSAHPLKGTTRGQISIEWKDAAGNEVSRTWGPDWGAPSADSWTQFKMTGEAPARATQGVAVITVQEGKEPGGGSFYADEMSLTEVGAAK